MKQGLRAVLAGLVVLAGLCVVGSRAVAQDQTVTVTLGRSDPKEAAAHQRLTALAIQKYVNDEGMKDLAAIVPPSKGIGISFGPDVTKSDKKGAQVGIRVVGVFRDSAAGRAGILPGDWVTAINGTKLGSVFVAFKDDGTSEDNSKEKELSGTAGKLFAQADRLTVQVSRGGKELTFTLERGPIALGLASAITAKLPSAQAFLDAQKPKADLLVSDLEGEPKDEAEVGARNHRIQEFITAIRGLQIEFQQLVEDAQVPEPSDSPSAK